MGGRLTKAVVLALAAALSTCAAASGAPEPQAHQANDFRGFNDVLPPGANGRATALDLAEFLRPGGGGRPPHNNDQLGMYGDLVYSTPGLAAGDIGKFFKPASFGVAPGDLARQYSPRDDVTIQRDNSFGVAHVYGATREGAMFGTGYVGGEDRLFFIDVLRHLGRAQLSSFAGGAEGNRDFDAEQWSVAPYTEEDLQLQFDQLDELYGADGRKVQSDIQHYVDGVNKYIGEAKTDPTKMPGEYEAIDRPQGADPWKVTDIIATAALVGGIFGRGGGNEVESALLYQRFVARFGRKAGPRRWADFRSAEDPDAPTTVFSSGRAFPYQVPPKRVRGLAMPDPGSVKRQAIRAGEDEEPGGPSPPCVLNGLFCFPETASNSLQVSARESKSGRALAVFGPQTGYFSPQILMELDIHAPDIDARGAAFAGVNMYIQLGRGRDYSWSATSASQDNTDAFALDLCEPGGGAATAASMHYSFRGECRPIEVLTRNNSWVPNAADQSPPGSETLEAQRTALGIVTHRGAMKGKPVIYTRLRSTYMHEVDSAPGFADFNDPAKITGPREFQRAAHKIGYTFNWLYNDDKHIAYFNSGANPQRAKNVDNNFPTRGEFPWKGYDFRNFTAKYTPFEQHPQVVDQEYITSWNNKQARGYRAADSNYGFSSVYRSLSLDERVKSRIRGSRKIDLPGLIDAMEDAGTVDVRGAQVLPYALKVLGTPRDPALADAVGKLRAWVASGAHRRDRDRNGVYEDAEAVRIMDAWWPLMTEAQFRPVLGPELYSRLQGLLKLDNEPNNGGQHLGSAYQDGWYGYAKKDLRTMAGRRVRGPYSRKYCGKGKVSRCRAALESSLKAALAKTPADLYGGDAVCQKQSGLDPQWCFDAVMQRPLGGITQPLIHWINRPTYQQAVEIQGHR